MADGDSKEVAIRNYFNKALLMMKYLLFGINTMVLE